MQKFGPDQCIYRLQAKEPVGSVRLGEIFRAQITNAFGKKFRRLDEFELFMQGEEKKKLNHPCTGPIHIEGAGNDSSVVINIRQVTAENALSCVSKSTGFLRGDFEARHPNMFDNDGGFARMRGVLVRSDPSLGVVATLDTQDRSAGRCTENGGNIDIPYLNEGSRIYLPVNHPEALIAIGDLHFRQGHGEAPGMGLEADGEVELEVGVCEKIPYPIIDNHEYLSVIGWGSTQKEAQERAVRNTIDYLKRLTAFRLWSDANIYQFLGGFGLVPGNSTGNVATFAQTIRKQDVLDPVSRQTVILPPIHRIVIEDAKIQKENEHLLIGAVADYSNLPLIHQGDSREIRSLPNHPDKLVSVLRPFVYSFELKGATKIEGTDAIRAQINAHFSEVLKQGGIRTSTLATQENFLLMTKEEVANTIEIAFKTRFSGSPKHRYKNLLDTPTRNGGIITINSKHEPYIRFDWRNASPDEDQVIPEGLAENFIDVRNAKQTALSAYEMLRKDANSHYLELVDGCFFMSQDGRVICGEVSCDNMNFKYRGHNASYQAIFNDKSKENIQTKWSLILKLLNEGSRNKI